VDDVDAYLSELVARVHGVLGARLRGVYAIGSLALGDYRPGRSDIDVAAFAAAAPGLSERAAIVAALDHSALPCPARGLEFVLYAVGEAPRYAINLNTGRAMARHVSFDPTGDPAFWFVLDLAIARARSRALFGAAAAEVIPAMGSGDVRAALGEALSWYAADGGGGVETVLAACRAWRWACEGVWSSKGEAGRWAAARGDAPAVVAEALRARGVAEPDALDPAAVAGFVELVRGSL
jgi:hypothetical protein